jgi:hypothetical protein
MSTAKEASEGVDVQTCDSLRIHPFWSCNAEALGRAECDKRNQTQVEFQETDFDSIRCCPKSKRFKGQLGLT